MCTKSQEDPHQSPLQKAETCTKSKKTHMHILRLVSATQHCISSFHIFTSKVFKVKYLHCMELKRCFVSFCALRLYIQNSVWPKRHGETYFNTYWLVISSYHLKLYHYQVMPSVEI